MNERIMQEFEKTEEILLKAIQEINQMGTLNIQNAEILKNVVRTYKDICEVKDKKGGGSYERYSGHDAYGDGGSYERRRRDSMGRYTDDGHYQGSRYYDGGSGR